MKITRFKGDNYPIEAILTQDGVAVNLTGSTIVFNYAMGSNIKTIAGVITNPLLGEVSFSPTVTDFKTAGQFRYDIQRTTAGIIVTHILETLEIVEDVV